MSGKKEGVSRTAGAASTSPPSNIIASTKRTAPRMQSSLPAVTVIKSPQGRRWIQDPARTGRGRLQLDVGYNVCNRYGDIAPIRI